MLMMGHTSSDVGDQISRVQGGKGLGDRIGERRLCQSGAGKGAETGGWPGGAVQFLSTLSRGHLLYQVRSTPLAVRRSAQGLAIATPAQRWPCHALEVSASSLAILFPSLLPWANGAVICKNKSGMSDWRLGYCKSISKRADISIKVSGGGRVREPAKVLQSGQAMSSMLGETEMSRRER